MGIQKFFHKIIVGFIRLLAPSIPKTDDKKKYGSSGENDFIKDIKAYLPDCKIKRNVIIHTSNRENAEIDCLLLYKNKLFAIEVKSWKGRIVEYNENKFLQYTSRNVKEHNSPFKQLKRAVYLLKKEIPQKAWINTVVFIRDSDSVDIKSDNVWFDDIDDLVSYIVNDGKDVWENNSEMFFKRCNSADYLYRYANDSFLQCQIYNFSFKVDKNRISSINISHHWSYDTIKIYTCYGKSYTINSENAFVYVIDNGQKYRYPLCKLDYIELQI